MKFYRIHILIIASTFFCGCSSQPSGPEEVLRDFLDFQSDGNCEDAIELTSGDIRFYLQMVLDDNNCDKYQFYVESIDCQTSNDETATCSFSADLGFGPESGQYILKKSEGEWKVDQWVKDMGTYYFADGWEFERGDTTYKVIAWWDKPERYRISYKLNAGLWSGLAEGEFNVKGDTLFFGIEDYDIYLLKHVLGQLNDTDSLHFGDNDQEPIIMRHVMM